MNYEIFKWKKPKVIIIDLKEYEETIIANARSGGGYCVTCLSCVSCGWSVGNRVKL